MKLSYYPGCSLHGTALEYDRSVRAVFKHLGVDLEELEDWNCCGASAAHSVDRVLAMSLPARNLALAQDKGQEVVVPCAACFSRHRAVEEALAGGDSKAQEIAATLGLNPGKLPLTRSVVSALLDMVGPDKLRQEITRPLEGVALAPYYGCLMVRPRQVARHPRPEDPQELDQLIEISGGEAVKWSYKTDCCGGGLSVARSDVVGGLVEELLVEAEKAGAEALVTACPMCLANLEMRRDKKRSDMPVIYVTEMVGLAMGVEGIEECLSKHLVDPRPVVSRRWS